MDGPRDGRMTHTALVTGANRGIGLEVCRQLAQRGLSVVLTSRSEKNGRSAAAVLRDAEGLDVRYAPMDVADDSSVRACADELLAGGIQIDVVVNNAAICPAGSTLSVGSDIMVDAVQTILLGAFRVCRAFAPAMVDSGYGRIVNVSSGWGAFAEGLGGPAAYSVTKAALNALTVTLAAEIDGDNANVKVNAVCPGWVQTRMGGPGATRPVEDGADTIVWLSTLPDDGPTGGFFRDRLPIQW